MRTVRCSAFVQICPRALCAGIQKKKDPRGSLFNLPKRRLLLLVAAFASRVARHAALLVVRAQRVALVGVARIASLGAVADALVALLLRWQVDGAAVLTAGNRSVRQRDSRFRQQVTIQ